MKTKLMVAAGIAAAGLMLTAVGGWVPLADAQDVPPVPAREAVRPAPQPDSRPVPRPPERPTRVEDEEPPRPSRPPEPPRPPRVAEPVPAGPREPGPPPDREALRRPQQRMEHLLRDVPGSKDELTKLILDEQSAGWEFAGQVDAGKMSQLVFKRPKGNPPGNWAPQPGAGIPRIPADPAQPPRGVPPHPADPFVVPPRRGQEELPMAVPQPRRSSDRLPPRIDDGDELPPTAIIGVGPARISPSPTQNYPDQYSVPFTWAPAGGPVRALPPPANAEPLEIHVLELKNATPAAMSLHVKKFFDSAEVSIDEDTGSLVIRCGKKTLEDIKKLVEKLDKPSKRGGA